jgi:hypothetical protein
MIRGLGFNRVTAGDQFEHSAINEDNHHMNHPTPKTYELSTKQFAALNHVKPQSVRARVCRTGSFYGIKFLKLASGRLAFPAVQVAA